MSDDLEPNDSPAGDPPPQSPADVRRSPEYLELQKENRRLAREAGAARSAAEKARITAEASQAAAEAQQRAAVEAEIERELGTDGIAAYNEIAQLSASDPVGAARRLRELMTAAAQSGPPATPAGTGEADGATGQQEGEPVPGQAASQATPPQPPANPSQLDASAPLGSSTTDEDFGAIISAAETRYGEVVGRNRSKTTRNRVTMRERAGAFMDYLAASYLKAGARPRPPREGEAPTR